MVQACIAIQEINPSALESKHDLNNYMFNIPTIELMKKIFTGFILLITINCVAQQLDSFQNGKIKLYYETAGSGQPIYLLAGGPGYPPEIIARQLRDSLKNKFTVIVLHQRGSGKSKNIVCNEETINIAAYVSDLFQLMKVRGDSKAILLGESWGGLLAQAFAATHPQLVAKLILVASAPPSYKFWHVLEDNQYARSSQNEKDSMQLLQRIFEKKTPAALDQLKQTHPEDAAVKAYYQFVTILHRNHYYNRSHIDPEFDVAFYNFNFQPIPFIDKDVLENKRDYTAQLKKLFIPVLIIYGRQDDQGESTFQEQIASFKNKKVVVLEKCGHEIIQEQPQQFFKALLGFLQ